MTAALFLALFSVSLSTKPESLIRYASTPYTELPAGTNGSAGISSSYVLFGDWPQSMKSASVTVDEAHVALLGSHAYFKGSDGNWYYKTVDSSYLRKDLSSLRTNMGLTFPFEDSVRYFKVEPIKWRILSGRENGRKLLQAENPLFHQDFSEQFASSVFLHSAFTPAMQDRIITSTVVKSANGAVPAISVE